MAKSVEMIPAGNGKYAGKPSLIAAYCRVSTACEEQMGRLESSSSFTPQ